MSSLTGIAQFTNRFAQNIMGYEEDKKVEAERVEDKQYNRARQQQQDKNAQENHDVTYEGNQITLSQNKTANKEFQDADAYNKTGNQLKHLKSMGAPEEQSIDVLSGAVNSNSKLLYRVEFERGQDGKIIQRKDEAGKPFYFQTLFDKETGEELGRKATTLEEATNNYTQLQRGGAIEAENAMLVAARAAKVQEIQDELTLKTGESKIKQTEHAANKGVDHGYAVSLEGVKFDNTTTRDAALHGYGIDKQNNQAGHAQSLAYIQGELAAGRIDQQAYNRMEEYLYKAGVDQGQTPGVTLGKDRASQVSGIIGSLTGTESSGNSGAFRTNDNGKSYGGLIQMGDDRLKDYATATGSRPISANQFKNLPAAQQRAANEWHINDLISAAQATGAVGKVINGVPVTLGGLVAVAHLGGKGGMNKFVQTNGRYNPKDQLGTSLTDYLVKHRSSTAGGVQTTLTQPLAAKAVKGTGKNSTTPADSGKGIATKTDYNANVDKGFNSALKLGKSYGIKSSAASTAQLSQASSRVKFFASARSYEEVSSLYAEAVNLAVKAIPPQQLRKLSNDQKKAIGEKMVLTMAGASSQANLLETLYRVNPSARSKAKGGLTLPGQQVSAPTRTAPQSAQSGKLQSLYARGLPPVKTDPKTAENLNHLENLGDNIDWSN